MHGAEKPLDRVFEKNSHNENRDHGNGDFQEIISLVVILEFEKALEKPPNLFVENDYRTEDSSRMHNRSEHEVIGCLHTEQSLAYFKMSAAAYRQKFSQALQETE